MRNRTILIIVSIAVILIIGILAMVHNMGGFNDPVLSIGISDTHILVGKEFKGPRDSPEIGKLWGEMEKMAESGMVEGDVAAIWYNEPSTSEVVRAFIGILMASDATDVPEGYELRRLEARQVVRAEQQSHHLVAGPLYEHIREFAEGKGVKLSEESLEIYPGEQQVIFEVPVVE